MDSVATPEDLQNWLLDKPTDWHKAIALRSALRVFPLAISPENWLNSTDVPRLALSLFRASSISFALQRYPTVFIESVEAVLEAAEAVSNTAHAVSGASKNAVGSFYSAARISHAEYSPITEYGFPYDAARAAQAASGAIRNSNLDANAHDAALHEIDIALAADMKVLMESSEVANLAALLTKALWPIERSSWVTEAWAQARLELLTVAKGFADWTNWYDRRLRGEEQAFPLDSQSDVEMNRRLVEAGNEWWNRDSAEVNGDIAAWLAELQWHDLVSRVDRISQTVEAGAIPDLSSPEAISALNAMTEAADNVLAAVEEALPRAAGDNYFETDDILPADSQAQEAANLPLAAPQLPATVAAELHTLREEVDALKRTAVHSRPDPKQLGKSLTWLKNRLEQYRQVSPEFMKQFEGKLGMAVAGGVVIGFIQAFPKVVSLLEILVKSTTTLLEVALRIAH